MCSSGSSTSSSSTSSAAPSSAAASSGASGSVAASGSAGASTARATITGDPAAVKMGLAYDIGGRGDQSFNDLAAKALDQAKAQGVTRRR